MSDKVRVVVEIPKETYLEIRSGFIARNAIESAEAIKNGTPLPAGHGDLIDRNKIAYMKAIHDLKWGKITATECATKIKYSAPTIIEADEEGETKPNEHKR